MAITSFYIPPATDGERTPKAITAKNRASLVSQSTKFLFFGNKIEGVLVIGKFEYHKDLVNAIAQSRLPLPSAAPIGAGNLENGHITTWKSWGFNFTTPQDIRPIIEKILV